MLRIFNKTHSKAGLVGLYATPEKLTLAQVVPAKDKPELLLCEEAATTGAENHARVLDKLVDDHGLEGHQVCYVLSPNEYKLLLVEAPNVEPEEMAGAVKWKIKDLVGHPIEEMVITVFDVPEGAYRSQADMVYAVAARKSRIFEIVNLVHGAELELSAIDIPELAMMNLAREGVDDTEGLAFLDLRDDGSTLNLSRGGEIYLTRQLSTRVDNQVMNTQEWTAVRERLVLEIQRSLDYYQSQMGQTMVPRIVIAPRADDVEMLARELGMAMSLQVETMDMSGFLQSQDELPMETQQSCMLAIAAALRQEEGAVSLKTSKANAA